MAGDLSALRRGSLLDAYRHYVTNRWGNDRQAFNTLARRYGITSRSDLNRIYSSISGNTGASRSSRWFNPGQQMRPDGTYHGIHSSVLGGQIPLNNPWARTQYYQLVGGLNSLIQGRSAAQAAARSRRAASNRAWQRQQAAQQRAAQRAAQQRARQRQARSAIGQAFEQFNPEFYNQRAQQIRDFYSPQLDTQYNVARDAVNQRYADQGLGSSSGALNAFGNLDQLRQQQIQGINERATQGAADFQNRINQRRQQLLSQFANDPAGARTAATQAAQQFRNDQYQGSPLGNVFNDFVNAQRQAAQNTGPPGLTPLQKGRLTGGGGGGGGISLANPQGFRVVGRA